MGSALASKGTSCARLHCCHVAGNKLESARDSATNTASRCIGSTLYTVVSTRKQQVYRLPRCFLKSESTVPSDWLVLITARKHKNRGNSNQPFEIIRSMRVSIYMIMRVCAMSGVNTTSNHSNRSPPTTVMCPKAILEQTCRVG